MNIVINFDFFNAIRDANEEFLGFKAIRNNKRKWTKYNLFQINHSFDSKLLKSFLLGEDIYKKEAIKKLKSLIPQLEKINLETTYDLIIKSMCYDIITNFRINDNQLPELVESKYILVPSFDNGSIVGESVLQEHVLGSNTYTLSIGEPSKELKLAHKNL